MIRFKCPSCRKNLRAPEDKVGAKSSCPACKQALYVPPPVRNPSPTVQNPSSSVTPNLPAPVKKSTDEVILEVIPVGDIPDVLPAGNARGQHLTMKPSSYVTFLPNGQINLHARNVPEAKLAIQELRARKRQLVLAKRQIMQEQREIRAAYTHHVRQRGSKFIGGGTIGRIVRVVQTASRDSTRAQLANQLAPLEDERSRIEARITNIDYAILQMQRFIE